MRLIVLDEHDHFSQQTHAYAEYRAFSALAVAGEHARTVTVTLARRDAADAHGSVLCTVAVTTGAGEAAEVRALGRHAYAAIDRAVSLIRQSHALARAAAASRGSGQRAGKRVSRRHALRA